MGWVPTVGTELWTDFNLFHDMTLRHSCCSHFTDPVRGVTGLQRQKVGEVEKGTGLCRPGLDSLYIMRGKKAQKGGGRGAEKGRRGNGLLETRKKQDLRYFVYLTLSEQFANEYVGFYGPLHNSFWHNYSTRHTCPALAVPMLQAEAI